MNQSVYFGDCYKYRTFGPPDSKERGYLTDLIVNRHMMFSSPLTFNDPYDCRPTYTRGQGPKADRKRIEDAWEEGRVKAGHAKPTSKERSRHVSKVMAQLSTPEGAAAHFQPYLESMVGVFCMSKRWDLLTQWAYYADSGRGLRLEYDVQKGSGFERIYPVSYEDARPVVEISRTLYDREYQTDALMRAVTHKAAAWSAEEEVRALHDKAEVLQHPEDILTSIIVGQSVCSNDLNWLQTLLRENDMENISLDQVQLSETEFLLERHKVDQ